MNIIDVIIVGIVIIGALIGFRRGIITQTVSFVGLIAIFFVAYLTKGILAEYLCKWLPFININFYHVKSIQILNILFYEFVSFAIIFSLLMFLFNYLTFATEIFESILKKTIILALPLKLGGAIVGAIQYYLVVMFALIVMASPLVNIKVIDDSRLADKVMATGKLDWMPLDQLTTTLDDLSKLQNINFKNRDEAELQIMDVMLKNKITNVELIDDLIASNKIQIKDTEKILIKYRKEQ